MRRSVLWADKPLIDLVPVSAAAETQRYSNCCNVGWGDWFVNVHILEQLADQSGSVVITLLCYTLLHFTLIVCTRVVASFRCGGNHLQTVLPEHVCVVIYCIGLSNII